MNLAKISQGAATKTKDIWSVKNKGSFVKGEQKATYEKLSKEAALDPKQDAQLKKACQDFESFFLYYLMQQMHGGALQEDSAGILGGGRAKEIYRDMFEEQVADKAARGKGMGIASMLYENVKKTLVQMDVKPTK